MSKAKAILQRIVDGDNRGDFFISNELLKEIEVALTEPEQEQEPVAWITEWVQRYRHNDTPILDRAVSFTKGDAPAVPNPNYIPLYTSPPKREPIDTRRITLEMFSEGVDMQYKNGYVDGIRFAERQHGIGGGE